MRGQCFKKLLQLGVVFSLALILLIGLALSVQWADQAQARPLAGQTPQPSPTPVPRGKNLFYNGSFELGYYPVPELGFEPDEIGNIPHYWGWFKSNTFGKYDIDNNEGFRLVCPEDEELLWGSFNALAVYMQSTDQADARLGIYQTVDVVPGKDYLFSISGTIQAQSGASSPDINHRVQLAFDHTGGTDWTAIPFEEWTILPWREQLLEFSLSGPEDPDLAQVESFYTTVRARSNKMTVFIAAWRRWANWRSGVFTFDCAYLVPLDQIDPYTLTLILTEYSTTDVDVVVESSPMAVRPDAAPTPAPGATPAAAPAVAPAEPAPHPIDIPDSGGILETKRNTLLFIAAAIVIIVGLVGAGIWNIRRQKRQN